MLGRLTGKVIRIQKRLLVVPIFRSLLNEQDDDDIKAMKDTPVKNTVVTVAQSSALLAIGAVNPLNLAVLPE